MHQTRAVYILSVLLSSSLTIPYPMHLQSFMVVFGLPYDFPSRMESSGSHPLGGDGQETAVDPHGRAMSQGTAK